MTRRMTRYIVVAKGIFLKFLREKLDQTKTHHGSITHVFDIVMNRV